MGHCHAVEDLLIPDQSVWYAACFWPTYQSMTHVYMKPTNRYERRAHAKQSRPELRHTLAVAYNIEV